MLLRDLGAAFRGEALGYKPYPCGRPLHAAIDAALAARAQLQITRADDIAAVTIEADPAGHADQFERGPAKRRPTQVVEAQFAQPFLVTTALAHGRVGIAEVDGLGDPPVLALSDRTKGVANDRRKKGSLSVSVSTTDGRAATIEATDPIGSPQKPLTDAQFEAQFRDCARNAVQPLSDASIDATLARIARLEAPSDARELMAAFGGNTNAANSGRSLRSGADIRFRWQVHEQHLSWAADRARAMAATADIVGEKHLAAAAAVLRAVANFDLDRT